jgi:hypothetical protein
LSVSNFNKYTIHHRDTEGPEMGLFIFLCLRITDKGKAYLPGGQMGSESTRKTVAAIVAYIAIAGGI